MKKILSVLMVAIALMMAAPAQAQLFKLGVKGGVNMSKIKWNQVNLKENSTGFFIGPMAEVTIPLLGFGVDGALLYSQRGEHETKQQGLEIPLNLKYSFGLGSTLGVYLAAGPDFYFNLKDEKAKGLNKESAQVAVNVGAGVKLLRHLQFGINYQIPTGKSFKDEYHNEIKTKTWQLSAAYIF